MKQGGGNQLGSWRLGPGPGKKTVEQSILGPQLHGSGAGTRPERVEERKIPRTGPAHSPRGQKESGCERVSESETPECLYLLFLRVVVRFK